MDLREAFFRRNECRHDRPLESAGGGDDVLRLDDAIGGLDAEAVTRAGDALHLDAGADRCLDHLGIGDEIVGDLLLRGEGIVFQAGKGHAGETVVPGGAVGDEAVPAGGAPAFGDAVLFEHQMGHAALAEMFAHGDAGLAGADDERVHFFH